MTNLRLDNLVICHQCHSRIRDKQNIFLETQPVKGRIYCSGVCRLKTKKAEGHDIYTTLVKIQYTSGIESAL